MCKRVSYYKILLTIIAAITAILQLIVLEKGELTYQHADYLVLSSAINIMLVTIFITDVVNIYVSKKDDRKI